MDIETLTKFCHEDREPINRVHIKGGFAWVTDGNIGIRRKRDVACRRS